MSDRYLKTKFHIPSRRVGIVTRLRLLDQLNAGLSGRINLVTAPAGFGKTTLVVDWLHTLPFSDSSWSIDHCAWLSLDETDNSLSAFVLQLIGAIQQRMPGYAEDLKASLLAAQKLEPSVITRILVNDIDALAVPLLLVFDDYHVLDHAEIQQVMNGLVDYLPPHVFIVMTSRTRPALDLPRWQVRGWMQEIDAGRLRFDEAEVHAFFENTMRLSLPQNTIQLLENRTEGWVAGLQLAALSLRGAADPKTFVEGFSGRDRTVTDYLLAEVLHHQPKEIKTFLLQTSILKSFNAALCEAVILHKNRSAQEILEDLERRDLFLIPLDNERRWYRYHHLFAELLNDRLMQEVSGDELQNLHHRAAAWYEQEGSIPNAIEHYLLAEDEPSAARLIGGIPLHHLWEQEYAQMIPQWVDDISRDVQQQYPLILLQSVTIHLLRGEIYPVENRFREIENHPDVAKEVQVVKGVFLRNEGQVTQALELFKDAYENLPEEASVLRFITLGQICICYQEIGEISRAVRIAEDFFHSIQNDPGVSDFVLFQVHQMLGNLLISLGDLNRAEKIFRSGFDLVEKRSRKTALMGFLYAGLGNLHQLWFELEKAEEYFKEAFAWGERSGNNDILIFARLGLADVLAWRGDAGALEFIRQSFRFEPTGPPRFVRWQQTVEALSAFYEMRLGNLSAAIRWANTCGLSLADTPSPLQHQIYQILIAVRLEEYVSVRDVQAIETLIPLTEKLVNFAVESENHIDFLRDLCLKALILNEAGRTAEAIVPLHLALEEARKSGVVEVFLYNQRLMQRLLEKALSFGQYTVEIRRLLMAFPQEFALETENDALPPEMVEKLTNREAEVLRLVAEGLSNKDIQEKLMLSKNTVRTHLRNLYGKLGVSSRTQAVHKARTLDLL